jgi:hypothetical protein
LILAYETEAALDDSIGLQGFFVKKEVIRRISVWSIAGFRFLYPSPFSRSFLGGIGVEEEKKQYLTTVTSYQNCCIRMEMVDQDQVDTV